MTDQIIDKRTVAIPGPQGDLTPTATALRDQMQILHDQTEAISGSVVALQDSGVSQLVMSGTLTGQAVDARVIALAGVSHVFSLLADLNGNEAMGLPRGTLAYVTESDACYIRSSTAGAWLQVATTQRHWSGAIGNGSTLRAVVQNGMGQVQALAFPVSNLVQGATFDTGLTVPEGLRPVMDHAIAPLTAGVVPSTVVCTLEVRSDTGKIIVRNRGGSAVSVNTLSGSLTWLVES